LRAGAFRSTRLTRRAVEETRRDVILEGIGSPRQKKLF
jgi:hypothetical protein